MASTTPNMPWLAFRTSGKWELEPHNPIKFEPGAIERQEVSARTPALSLLSAQNCADLTYFTVSFPDRERERENER
jgi:hypothetical protein